MRERSSGIKCKCGGKLRKRFIEVEFFRINFGLKEANVCNACDSEYLPQEVMEDLETEVKKQGLFGLDTTRPCGRLYWGL